MNEYRHVCLKDLDNYFKREDYLGGLSVWETELIKENLKIHTIVRGTYDELKHVVDNKKLDISCKYVITDFLTIYLSNTGDIWGLDVNPSDIYLIILTPVTESTLNPNVCIIDSKGRFYDALYDINSEVLKSKDSSKEVSTKGKITYLKDFNGNSAYYDFKNIKYRITLSPEIDFRLQEPVDIDVFTFNTPTESSELYIESSDLVYNNELSIDCLNNIFLNKCYNNKLLSKSSNNLFIDLVSNINSELSNVIVKDLFLDDTLSVLFNVTKSRENTVANRTKFLNDRLVVDIITLLPNKYFSLN